MSDPRASSLLDPDFQMLVVRYLDNDLSELEVTEFSRLLEEDETRRQYLIDACCVASAIGDDDTRLLGREDAAPAWPQPDGDDAPRNPILGFLGDAASGWGSGWSGQVPFTLVAVALVLLVFGFGYFRRANLGERSSGPTVAQKSSEAERAADPCIARLIETVDCRWTGKTPRMGEPLHSGRRLRLEAGLAKIAFGKRAELILEGPADFAVTSATGGQLRYGQLSAEVFDAGTGFSIDAPGMRVLDLGTQFGFRVGSNGAGEVHVFKGEVEVAVTEPKDGSVRSRLLTENLAAMIDSHDGRIDMRKLDPARFIRTFDPSDLDITREYVDRIKQCEPIAYWRFEYLVGGCVLNEMSDHYRGSSPMRLVLSKDIQNKTLAVDQRSRTRPYMAVTEPIRELAGANFTIECWVKPDGYQWITPVMLYFPAEEGEELPAVASLVEFLPGRGNDFEPRARIARCLHRIPPSGIYGDGIDAYSDREYAPDQWHHLVMVNDDDEMRLYMNGKLTAQKPIADKIDAAPLVSIGRFNEFIYPARRASDKEMAGQIDEVAIYDRCLEESEILRHYHLGMKLDISKP